MQPGCSPFRTKDDQSSPALFAEADEFIVSTTAAASEESIGTQDMASNCSASPELPRLEMSSAAVGAIQRPPNRPPAVHQDCMIETETFLNVQDLSAIRQP
jgi:hypothetical protein